MSAEIAKRFWGQVDQEGSCWEWRARLNEYGYGVVRIDGRHWRAHRLSWVLTHGEIPAGMCVLHECDNRRCVNPAHLHLGTQAENMHDMMTKGRHKAVSGQQHGRHTKPYRTARGEKNGMSKLTKKTVWLIRAKARKVSATQLAREFGVSDTTIRDVVARRLWA